LYLIDWIETFVTRQHGLYGSVTVDYETKNGLATSNHGDISHIGLESVYNVSGDRLGFASAHHFKMVDVLHNGGKGYGDFLLLSTNNGISTLYKWMGTFVKVKVHIKFVFPMMGRLRA